MTGDNGFILPEYLPRVRRLAEEVMGLYAPRFPYGQWFNDKKDHMAYVAPCDDVERPQPAWDPFEDIAQAWELLLACEAKFPIRIEAGSQSCAVLHREGKHTGAVAQRIGSGGAPGICEAVEWLLDHVEYEYLP